MGNPARQTMAKRGATAFSAADVVQPMTWTGIGMVAGAAIGGIGFAMLSGATLPVVGGALALGAVGRLVGQEVGKKRDPFRSVVIGENESLEEVKTDVNNAMKKIQKYIVDVASKQDSIVFKSLDKKGRDHWFYARGKKLKELIETWNERWDIASTAGLLLDLQSAVKQIEALHKPVPGGGGLSKEQRDIRERGYDATRFGKEIKANFDVQAYPSATTANLLTFLRTIAPADRANITDVEIEAIMQAVIMFWEGRAKRYTGDYHTPVEVWMAYTRHLELMREKKSD